MAKEYLDKDGLLYFWQKIKNLFAVKSDAIKNITRSDTTFTATKADGTTFTFTQQDTTYSDATTSAHGLMTASDKTKLNGIATGAEVNQNAFGNINVGSTTIAADNKVDTLTFVAGSNVTLVPNANNDSITISATSTTYNDFVGSNNSTAGTQGLVPAPPIMDEPQGVVLTANGTWELIDEVLGASLASGGMGAVGYLKLNSSGVLIRVMGNQANGLAELDSSGKIPTSLLPSYVDDVIEAYARSGATALSSTWLSTTSGGSALTPETGKIYVLMADSGDYAANTQFRWSGTAYVKLADGGVSSITNAEIDTIVAS